MTLFNPETFKKINSELLHFKYPHRTADDNWLDSCEILNRIYQGKTVITCTSFNNTVESTVNWIQSYDIYLDYKEKTFTIKNSYDKSDNSLILGKYHIPLEVPHSKNQKTNIPSVKSYRHGNFVFLPL